ERDLAQEGGPFLPPAGGAGESERRLLVEPQRVAIARALDQHDISGLSHLGQAPQAVQHGSRPLLPPEAVLACERQAELHGRLLPLEVAIGDPEGQATEIPCVLHATFTQKWDRQLLRLGVLREGAAFGGGLPGCAVFMSRGGLPPSRPALTTPSR